MSNVDKELSRQAALRVNAEMSQCYSNACRALQEMHELAAGEYVMGLAVEPDWFSDPSMMVIESAWIELDGRIIDPTFPAGHAAYFPVVRYNGEVARAFELPSGADFVFFAGPHSTDFAESLVAACKFIIAQWPERCQQSFVNHIRELRAALDSGHWPVLYGE